MPRTDPPAAVSSNASRLAGTAATVVKVRKRYGGVQALSGVSLSFESGSIHAVVGENGAGKSTLMKVLAGAVLPDTGTVTVDGVAMTLGSPQGARQAGIGIVYQELSLLPTRTVLQNLFVNREPTRFGFVDISRMTRQAVEILELLGVNLDVNTEVGSLPIATQQLVEIARVLLLEPRVLILDEPNSALSEAETARLFLVLNKLAGAGLAIAYISHRLEEVLEIADVVTVMRGGKVIFTRPRSGVDLVDVVNAMIGDVGGNLFPHRTAPDPSESSVELSCSGLELAGRLQSVSLCAHAGEIVGLAGIDGSGAAELLRALFGDLHLDSGSARFPDGLGLPNSPTEAARRGIAYVPADRRRHGLMLDRSVASNAVHVQAGALKGRSWVSEQATRQTAENLVDHMGVSTRGTLDLLYQLSGGNQQKIVLGKWLETDPIVVLLDDPARGVDVGAKREIFKIVRDLADHGRIVLFRSSDVREVLGLSDRILVLHQGRVACELDGKGLTDGELLHAVNTGTER